MLISGGGSICEVSFPRINNVMAVAMVNLWVFCGQRGKSKY